MIIYNKTILEFKNRLLKKTKEILANECHLKVGRSRFSLKGYTYPIHLVVFEHASQLGFFKPTELTIGINKELITADYQKMVHDILRHEIAHYLSYIQNGADQLPHGQHFQNTCRAYGWGKEVSMAKTNLELVYQNLEGDFKTKALMEKVKKLLKLGSSANTHEAHLATKKANEYLLKYNLTLVNNDANDDLDYYQKAVLVSKKRTAKMEAIYEIVKQFFVKPVFSYAGKQCRLDLFGTRANIEFAEYVAAFLDHHLDELWSQAKVEFGYKGLMQKNSFFRGVADGFINKDVVYDKSFSLINKEIDLQFDRYINGRYLTSSGSKTDRSAQNAGKKMGKSLNINPALKNKSQTLYLES